MEVIDTRNMTVMDLGSHSGRTKVPLPRREYMAVGIRGIGQRLRYRPAISRAVSISARKAAYVNMLWRTASLVKVCGKLPGEAGLSANLPALSGG